MRFRESGSGLSTFMESSRVLELAMGRSFNGGPGKGACSDELPTLLQENPNEPVYNPSLIFRLFDSPSPLTLKLQTLNSNSNFHFIFNFLFNFIRSLHNSKSQGRRVLGSGLELRFRGFGVLSLGFGVSG